MRDVANEERPREENASYRNAYGQTYVWSATHRQGPTNVIPAYLPMGQVKFFFTCPEFLGNIFLAFNAPFTTFVSSFKMRYLPYVLLCDHYGYS